MERKYPDRVSLLHQKNTFGIQFYVHDTCFCMLLTRTYKITFYIHNINIKNHIVALKH